LDEPWLCGFGHSRPQDFIGIEDTTEAEDDGEDAQYLDAVSTEEIKQNINLDIYQHPQKRVGVKFKYQPGHDIYS
jgi:GH24 family phage-related lysozyme (muramidase)